MYLNNKLGWGGKSVETYILLSDHSVLTPTFWLDVYSEKKKTEIKTNIFPYIICTYAHIHPYIYIHIYIKKNGKKKKIKGILVSLFDWLLQFYFLSSSVLTPRDSMHRERRCRCLYAENEKGLNPNRLWTFGREEGGCYSLSRLLTTTGSKGLKTNVNVRILWMKREINKKTERMDLCVCGRDCSSKGLRGVLFNVVTSVFVEVLRV